jgi:SAM-dependent methyltransferase
MNDTAQEHDYGANQTQWRGIDFSGVTVALGVGTGRLIELLAQQVAQADGQLLAIDTQPSRLQALRPMCASGALAVLRARYRQLPLLGESVDLVVVNGVLREVPETRLQALFDEFWRVLVPGGLLRISDIIEPSEERYDDAWRARNQVVRKLAAALDKPAAVSVDLKAAARALRAVGFEELSVSLLPGYPLTEAWLEETVNALHSMAARIVDREQRNAIVQRDVPRLIAAFAGGAQRAAERFVLSGRKVGSLALDMQASFTEEDLLPEE